MAEHVRRGELKRNELGEAVGKGIHFADEHRRSLLYGLGGAVSLALIAFLVWSFVSERLAKTNDLLARGIRVYDAQVVDKDAKPDDPDRPTFSSEATRRVRAKDAFTELDRTYGGSETGALAKLYLAEIARQEGDSAAARKFWQAYADAHPKSSLAGAARLNLLQLDRDQGKGEEVAAQLKQMLDSPEHQLPDDLLLYQIAITYQKLGKNDEARAAFRRIVDEHPNSPYFQTAQQQAGPATNS